VEVRAISAYAITGKLGEGGMGVVWRARHPKLPIEVAVKVLKASSLDDDALARFRAEVLALSRVQHPNVVPVLDAGRAEDGSPFYVMPLVAGRSLESTVKESGPLEPRRAAEIVAKVARAVHATHANAAVVHRDLKPSNVMIEESTGEPKLFDFGLAKKTDAASLGPRTETGAVLGTPEYMAPEQASGENALVDARTDVYGLGATLYALLTGRPPFERRGRPLALVIAEVCIREPPSPATLRPSLPRDLVAIVGQAMAKERERRYPSALEVALDLERFGRGESVKARPPGVGARLARFVGRHRGGVAVTVAVAGAALITTTSLAASLARSKAELERKNAILTISSKLHEARKLADGGAFVSSMATPAKAVELRESVLEACAMAERTYEREKLAANLVEGGWLLVRARWFDEARGLAQRAKERFDETPDFLEIEHQIAYATHERCHGIHERIAALPKGPAAEALKLVARAEEELEKLQPDWEVVWSLARDAERAAPRPSAWIERIVARSYMEGRRQHLSIAVARLSKSLTLLPDDPGALAARARSLSLLGIPLDAVDDARQALARDERQPNAEFALADKATIECDWDRADAHLELWIAVDPASPAPHSERARLLALSGRPEAALAEATRAIELGAAGAHRTTALAARGFAYLDLGDGNAAERAFLTAVDAGFDTGAYWAELGYCMLLLRVGRTNEASRVCDICVRAHGVFGAMDPFVKICLGACAQRLGRPDARQYFKGIDEMYEMLRLPTPKVIRDRMAELDPENGR
jgi:tetratricopeptide (TPR) repeat protein